MFYRIIYVVELLFFGIFWAALLTFSSPPLTDEVERVRSYTRQIEFDYITWMMNALGTKLQQGSAGIPNYMDRTARKEAVLEYLRVTQRILEGEAVLNQIYADGSITDKESASQAVRADLETLYARQEAVTPFAEAVLQEQVTQIASEFDLTAFGQPIPTVLYHSSAVPSALIVSRRERIEQIANLSLETDLTIDDQADLETRVDEGLNVSSLIVPIGGVGVYPTMVMHSTSLDWLASTIAHEWTHNYLTLRPLGILYDSSPEIRTMNETTANIVGNEIGMLVLQRNYPELAHASPPDLDLVAFPQDHPDPGDLPRPLFDFRAQMHETRVTVDALLSEGKVEEAETYMQARQQVFLRNGYLLRKINQAYFSFYGAYADVPGGPAGEDPVGPAVRALRERSESLAEFVNRMSWMTSFEDLQKALEESH
jgi:hypothetical protein